RATATTTTRPWPGPAASCPASHPTRPAAVPGCRRSATDEVGAQITLEVQHHVPADELPVAVDPRQLVLVAAGADHRDGARAGLEHDERALGRGAAGVVVDVDHRVGGQVLRPRRTSLVDD